MKHATLAILFAFASAVALAQPDPSPTPTPTPPAAQEVRLVVRYVVAAGIVGDELTLRVRPGRAHVAGSGEGSKPTYSWEPSGKMIVLAGYAKKDGLAEGDNVTAQAYRDGAIKLAEDGFGEAPFPLWRVAE